MSFGNADIERLLHEFEAATGIQLKRPLGGGKDGQVFETDRLTAVKFLNNRDHYNRELDVYRLLAEENIEDVGGFQVPRLREHFDDFLAIEMTVVSPPFIVDFVSTRNDDEMERLGFTEETLEEREAFWAERFGDDWPTVVKLRDRFHALTGLTLLDLSHNNIRFE